MMNNKRVRWVEWKGGRGKTLEENMNVNTKQEIKFLKAVNVAKTRIQVANRKKAIAKRKKLRIQENILHIWITWLFLLKFTIGKIVSMVE